MYITVCMKIVRTYQQRYISLRKLNFWHQPFNGHNHSMKLLNDTAACVSQ